MCRPQVGTKVLFTSLRDADFEKFNARGQEIEFIKSKCKQMEMMLESCEKALEKLEDEARYDCCLLGANCSWNILVRTAAKIKHWRRG